MDGGGGPLGALAVILERPFCDRRLLFVRPGGRSLLFLEYQEKRTLSTGNEICQTLAGERYLDPVRHLPRNPAYRRLEIRVRTINERPMTCR